MKQLVHKLYYPANAKLGLLVLRLTLGGIFLSYGLQKLTNIEGTIAVFGTLGFGAFWAWLVALTETIGGIAVIVGFGTRIAASFLAIIMLVVITVVKGGQGFAAAEFDIVLLGLALGIGLIGCGKWSMCGKMHSTTGVCNDCGTDNNGCCGCSCGASK